MGNIASLQKSSTGQDAHWPAIPDDFVQVQALNADEALQLLRVDKNGLSQADAKVRLSHYGPNHVGAQKQAGFWHELKAPLSNPLNALLGFLAVAFYFLVSW